MEHFLFVLSIILIVYVYIGYPILLFVLSAFISKPVKKGEVYPSVTIFISAYNEEKIIEEKVNNLIELDYPRDKLEIIVGSDGSTDETYRIIKRLAEENKIRYSVSFQRIGKPFMLNIMAKDARGDIYAFADARQKFAPDALKELMSNFADEDVGAVSGELIIQDKEKGTGGGIGLYWKYEKLLRRMESLIGSTVGTTGAIYAIRKELFRYLPNVILDDVYVPMNAVIMNKRVVFEPKAKAYDVVSDTAKKEFARKVRTLLGNFQIFLIFADAMNPFKSSVAFQLISHKLMRLLVPYLLILLFLSNIFLLTDGDFFVLAFFLQVFFYIAAYFGYLIEKSGVRLKSFFRVLYIPYEFCMLNLAAAVALQMHLAGKGKDVRWEKPV